MPNNETRSSNMNLRRILLDTNVLLDAVDRERKGCENARNVLRHCNGYSRCSDMGVTTPMSLKDAYYILTKRFGEPHARKCIDFLSGQLIILPFGAEECLVSIKSNEPDFEDGLIRAAAELNEVDFIISGDRKAFQYSHIRKLACEEYLNMTAAERKTLNHAPTWEG